MTFEEYEATQNGGQPDASIDKVDLSQYPDEDLLDDTKPVVEEKPPVVDPAKVEPEVKEPVVEPDKKVQTPEENAKFAEQRRQQQVEKRVQDELAKIKQTDPAFKIAQMMEKMYGLPMDQIQVKIEEAMIAEEAKLRNVPVEQVQQEHVQQRVVENTQTAFTQTQEDLNIAQFQLWNHRVDAEAVPLKQALSMLNDDDFTVAKEYMLTVMRNPDASLESAVYAVHGAKITQSIREIAKNDALAEVSGRTANSLPPTGGKPPVATTLTDDEKYAAKHIFKMSEEEYAKYKS